jgi:hypothetical protein
MIITKMHWATFWATFSQTHLVTLKSMQTARIGKQELEAFWGNNSASTLLQRRQPFPLHMNNKSATF